MKLDMAPNWESIVAEAIEPSFEAIGDQAVKRARQLAPVRTGRLRSSIKTQTRRSGADLETAVFADAPYARFVEYGTSRQGAQPYIRPGVYQSVR